MLQNIMSFLLRENISNLIAIIVTVAGGCGWLIAFINNSRNHIRNIRLQIYQESLAKLDELNALISRDFVSSFINNQISYLQRLIQDPSSAKDYLASIIKNVYEEMSKLINLINKAFTEFEKLRLVASKKTLVILNCYRELAMQQARDFTEILEALKSGHISGGKYITSEMKTTLYARDQSEKIKNMRTELENQMRKDIGTDRN